MDDKLGLKEIGEKHGTDKFNDDINYTEPYIEYFEKLRDLDIKILEIGVATGAGVLTWNEYFKNAQIFGMDNWNKHHWKNGAVEKIEKENIKFFKGSQESRGDLGRLTGKFGAFDIIIDDGGHSMSQQQVSLGYLFKFLNPGGIYVIEDLVTSFEGFARNKHKDYGNRTPDDIKLSTLDFLKKMSEGNPEKGVFLEDEEFKYLLENIKSCEIFQNIAEYKHIDFPGSEIEKVSTWPSTIAFITKK